MIECDSNTYGPAPLKDPLSYPGKRPDGSFLFCYDQIYAISDGDCLQSFKVNGVSLERELQTRNAAPLSKRYAVLAYGSNANPAQLKEKFEPSDVFPVLQYIYPELDVVYSAGFTGYGVVPATLQYSSETTLHTWVALLDDSQLEKMDRSEGRGRNYWLTQLPAPSNQIRLSVLPLYAYLSINKVLKLQDSPIRVAGTESICTVFPEMNQSELLSTLQQKLGVPGSVDRFLSVIKSDRNLKIHLSPYRQPYSKNLGFRKIIRPEKPTYTDLSFPVDLE